MQAWIRAETSAGGTRMSRVAPGRRESTPGELLPRTNRSPVRTSAWSQKNQPFGIASSVAFGRPSPTGHAPHCATSDEELLRRRREMQWRDRAALQRRDGGGGGGGGSGGHASVSHAAVLGADTCVPQIGGVCIAACGAKPKQ